MPTSEQTDKQIEAIRDVFRDNQGTLYTIADHKQMEIRNVVIAELLDEVLWWRSNSSRMMSVVPK